MDDRQDNVYDDSYVELLRQRNRIMSNFIENSNTPMYVSDFYTCEILFANRMAKEHMLEKFGFDEIIGMHCWKGFNQGGMGRCPFCPYERLVDKNGKPTGQYVWEHYFPHMKTWLKIISEAIIWVDGRTAMVVSYYDVTETKSIQEKLMRLAYSDPMLELPNALKLEQDLREVVISPSLIVFDVVSLQKVNEAYGRDTGDKLLVAIRDWVLALNIPYSKLYRIAGDDFCLSVGRISNDALRSLAETIGRRFSEPWYFEQAGAKMTIFCALTIGIIHSEFVRKDRRLINLIERTLKIARSTGKVAVCDEESDKQFKKHLQFELSLKRCVRENMDGFDMYYQPIADPITGTWYGLEALCRWNSPELGIVSPNMFIPEVERLELIGPVGLWALETAIMHCKKLGLDKNRKFILDINVSAIQFVDEALAEKIIYVLKKHDFPCEKLCLEITESTQFTFTNLSLQTIQHLRKYKILVALDDFGTGYSGFHNLKTLPVDIVKIERTFVTNIENDNYQQYLFHAMAELAHAADMKLVAEGVESRDQIDILLKNGADYLQGYLFSKPMPIDVLETKLSHFYNTDPSFSVIRNRKIDMKELLDTESTYILTPNLYKILNRGMRILFYHSDIDEAVDQVLKIVGLHMDVSRAYLFLREHDKVYSNIHEWCADGITPQISELQNVVMPDIWLQSMERDGIIVTSDISSLSHEEYKVLKSYDLKALVVIPLWEDQELLGFVGFDDCRYNRDWRPEEIILLHNLCVIVTNMLSKKRLKDEVTKAGIIGILRDKMYMPQ